MSHVKDGRAVGRGWIAVITDPKAPSGKWSRTFATKAEARNFVTTEESKKLDGRFITPAMTRVVFRERYDKWVASAVNLREGTKHTEGIFARSLILPTFGDVALGDIDMELVQAWIQELIEANYAASTIHKAHQVLSRALSYSVKSKHLLANPCAETTLPTIVLEEQRILSPAEIAALAEVIDPRYRLWLLLAAYGGPRAEEAFGLRAGRVDRTRPEIDIVETVVQVGEKVVFGKPKTKAGKRRIELPEVIWTQAVEEVADMAPDALVFTSPDGDAVRLRNFRKRVWYPATIAAGLGQMVPCLRHDNEPCPRCKGPGTKPAAEHYVGLRIHDLRHTAVSLWIEMGSNPLQIKRRAGHSKVAFTFDRYGHLMPDETDPTMAKLDAIVRTSLGRPKVTPLHAVS